MKHHEPAELSLEVCAGPPYDRAVKGRPTLPVVRATHQPTAISVCETRPLRVWQASVSPRQTQLRTRCRESDVKGHHRGDEQRNFQQLDDHLLLTICEGVTKEALQTVFAREFTTREGKTDTSRE